MAELEHIHPALSCRISVELKLDVTSSRLSLAGTTARKKDVIAGEIVSEHRILPSEHYDRFSSGLDGPMIVAGARNVLSNLRCLGWSKEHQTRASEFRIARVAEEHEEPGRPYHAIVCRGERINIEEFEVQGRLSEPQTQLQDVSWMVTGTPVHWDGDADDLFERMITDAPDHSHVWHLPRGNHVAATEITRMRWAELQAVFAGSLGLSRRIAAEQLLNCADRFGLRRECDYVHSVWGVTDDEKLVIVCAQGKLEDVGKQAARLGCRRAICVENGGSVAVYHVRDPVERPWLPLVRAPNLRPAGTAFVFLSLRNDRFAVVETR